MISGGNGEGKRTVWLRCKRYEGKTHKEFLEYFGGKEHLDKLANKPLTMQRCIMAMDGSTIRKILGGDGKIKNSLETGKGTFKTIVTIEPLKKG
jgi:hypothetical protein